MGPNGPKVQKGVHFAFLEPKMRKSAHFAFLVLKMQKRAHFRFLGPKSVKSEAETIGFISICGQGAKMTPKCIFGPQNAFLGPKCDFGPKMRFWAPKCAPGKGVQGGYTLFRTAVVKSDVSKMLFL